MPDLSGLLGALLSNPSALATVINLFSGLGGQKEAPCASEEVPCPPPCPEDCPPPHPDEKACGLPHPPPCREECDGKPPPPCPPCPLPRKKRRCDERRALLFALRPFLSEGRQGALDSILSVLEILELFEKKNGGCG